MKKIFAVLFSLILVLTSNVFALTATGVATLGDSITSGSTGSTSLMGYRQQLQMLLGVTKYTFVGDQTAPANARTLSFGTAFSLKNGGVGGNTTTQVIAREAAILSQLTGYTNSIAIILAGINDVGALDDPAVTTTNLQTIVNSVISNNAATVIYVMLLLPTGDAVENPNVIIQNADYLPMLQTIQGTSPQVHIINMYNAFNDIDPTHTATGKTFDTYFFDGIHPNDQGYGYMAHVIRSCMQSTLSKYCDGH